MIKNEFKRKTFAINSFARRKSRRRFITFLAFYLPYITCDNTKEQLIGFAKLKRLTNKMYLFNILLQFLSIALTCGYLIQNDHCSKLDKNKGLTIHVNNSREIELGAFDNCPDMTRIHISGSVGVIHPEIFRNNGKLEEISIVDANLHKIHGETFKNLQNLQLINLANNVLIDFPVYAFPELSSLKAIYLDNNLLTDIDVEEMSGKFPSLTKIRFYNNSIECGRYKVIRETLISRNYLDDDRLDKCIKLEEIEKIFKDAKVDRIRGRLENDGVKEETKRIKRVNKKLEDDLSWLGKGAQSISSNISEVYQVVMNYTNQASEIEGFLQTILTIKEGGGNATSFVAFAIAGLTLMLAIVIGTLIKCFLTMRKDLEALKKLKHKDYQLMVNDEMNVRMINC